MVVKYRILHMIGSLSVGGSQAFVMNLYRNIDRNKIQFDFIVDSSDDNFFEDEIVKLGGKIFYFPKFNGLNYFEIRHVWKDFFVTHPEYKVIHSHVRSYASLYLPIANSYGLTTIIHSHSTSNGKGFMALCKKILQFPLRFQADYYMACSLEAGEWLFGKRICKSTKFSIIKNAIDVDNFKFNLECRKHTRIELNLKKEFVLGYLARVTEAKNPFFVIRVFNEIHKMNQNTKLLFVGDGDLLAAIKKEVINLKIEDSVIFTGTRTDVSELMSAMDYYILPSFWEGLGISLIEAQASGLHCICSEGIPDEAIITNLVQKYSLNLKPKIWADTILDQIDLARKDESESVKNAGYDIKRNSRSLVMFYVSCFE